jgi:hypothetical protein
MSKLASTLGAALALVALAACSEKQLTVKNLNEPDESRALASATDVENLVGSQFRNIHNWTDGVTLSLNAQLLCFGMENFSGLANQDMAKTCGIPRVGIDNGRGNTSATDKYNPYLNLYRAARSVALGLNAMDQPGFTFLPPSAAEVARDQAFGYFEIAVALGDIALTYDSGAVVSPGDDVSEAAPPLIGHAELMAAALADLDTAQQYATQAATGSNGFPLPDNWINGNALSAAQFVQLIHSWKARFRAGVARTPAERAAVDWAQVIADAQAGIAADFNVDCQSASPSWGYRPVQMDLYQDWHQMWQFMVGMADTSGTYSQYLANPDAFSPFLVVSPDARIPSGETRAAQNTSSGCGTSACTQPAATLPYPYLRNRLAGADAHGAALGFSMYDFYRFQSFFSSSPPRTGPIPTVPLAEMNGLIAEGKLRSGGTHDAAGAIAAINVTRTAAGLPAIPAGSDSGTVVPGGSACVPIVPAAPNYTSATCGTVWEAMKWEKRMETAYTHWGAWWIDGRGWGDLPINTPLEFPTPYQELDTRLLPIYSTVQVAARGTYGL